MIHPDPHPLAGLTVRIKPNLEHPDYTPRVAFGGLPFLVHDYFDRLRKQSWQDCHGHPLCLMYAIHVGETGLPWDDEVLFGKIGTYGFLVHVSELEVPEEFRKVGELEDLGPSARGLPRLAAAGSSPALPGLLTGGQA